MLRYFSFAVVIAALCACGDDAPPSGGGDVPIEDVGVELAGAVCPDLVMCLGPLADVFLAGIDCEELLAAQYEDATLPRWQEVVASGGATYDPAAMRACIDALAAAGCDVFDNIGPDPCAEAFTGTVDPGGACEATIECVGDAYCRVDAACPGTCATRVGEGMPCTVDQGCRAGLVCDGGACATPAGAGEPCEGGVAPACRAGLICRGEDESTMTAGTCGDLDALLSGAEGEPCDLETTLCMEGLSCAAVSAGGGECRAPVGSGEACFFAVPDMCPANEACDADPFGGMFMGNCAPLPVEGAACRASAAGPFGKSCEPGFRCVDGVCASPKRLGQACTSDESCISGACDGTVCVEPALCE